MLKIKIARIVLLRYWRFYIIAILCGLVGVMVLAHSHALTPTSAVEAEGGTLTTGATSISDSTASGSQAIKFGSVSVSNACPSGANTPGGSDGHGGCFPGAFNTGYPHSLPGDTRLPVVLTPYTASCTITVNGTTIDGKAVDCSNTGLFIYATNVTIKNSKVLGVIYENNTTASLTVMDSEVDGGAQYIFPTIGGGNNVTVMRVNAYGGEHTIQCYANCDVENSWLHDQFEAGPGPHQNGFLSNGGSNFVITHNSIYCAASGCTADVAFTDDDITSNALIDRNLFVAAPLASYCLDASSVSSKGNAIFLIKVTNNIFQRGTNTKCATYGPVYGWDPVSQTSGTTGYGNVWSGNTWNDGTILNSP